MPYPQAFFEIQLTFSRKMTEVTLQPYHESLLRNTALYRILGLDWSFDPDNPVWQRFVEAVRSDTMRAEAAYRFYVERYERNLIPDYTLPRWGCLSYEYQCDTQVISLHFANLDTSGYGPLSHQRREARLVELSVLFSHIRTSHPDAERVHGASWLYNREEYRRLFPPEYGQSARADQPYVTTRGLWGQFLRHGNRLNEGRAGSFLQRVAELRDAHAYADCFPYQVLLTRAPIAPFYDFYGVPAAR